MSPHPTTPAAATAAGATAAGATAAGATAAEAVPFAGLLDWLVEPGAPATVRAPELADAAAARDWLAEHHAELRAGLDRFGAVYVSGLPVRSVDDFAVVRDELVRRATPYREKATPAATSAPASSPPPTCPPRRRSARTTRTATR